MELCSRLFCRKFSITNCEAVQTLSRARVSNIEHFLRRAWFITLFIFFIYSSSLPRLHFPHTSGRRAVIYAQRRRGASAGSSLSLSVINCVVNLLFRLLAGVNNFEFQKSHPAAASYNVDFVFLLAQEQFASRRAATKKCGFSSRQVFLIRPAAGAT